MIDYIAYQLSKEDFDSRINLLKRGKYLLVMKSNTSVDAAERVIGLGLEFSRREVTR